MDKKACFRCGKVKKLDKFRVDSRRPDGKRSSCKKCERVREKAYYRDVYSDKDRRINRLLDAAKARAKRRRASFSITRDDVVDQIESGVCSVTGIEFSYERLPDRKRNPFAPSIDRIDSSKGYTPDNVRVVCLAFNLMSSDWRDEVFEKVAKAYLKEKKRAKPDKKTSRVPKKAPKPRHRPKDGVVSERGGKGR